jgi:hypothetical protein
MQIWYKDHPPRRHDFNESLHFRLGSGGIDLGARSKSFGARSRRSSPSETFIEFLRTSFSNFLGKLVRWFSRATLACRSGGELFRTGIVSPRSKALSKIFENSEPQIPEKDGEMKKKGTEGQITANYDCRLPRDLQVHQKLTYLQMWRESRTRDGCAMRPSGLKMTPASLQRLGPILIFGWNGDRVGRSSVVVSNSAEFSLARGFATLARILITGSHSERAKRTRRSTSRLDKNERYQGFY